MAPSTEIITPDEIVVRHIPGGSLFVKPPPVGPSITSANFRLRKEEEYISVGRLSFHSDEEIIAITGGDRSKGSLAGWCRVSDLIAAGFRVVPKTLPHYPGHAGIFGSEAWPLTEKRTQQYLASLFRFTPVSHG